MLRHRKTCKSNLENHFDDKEKKLKHDIEYQKRLLIQDFQNLNLEKVAKEIKGLSNYKIKQNLIEYISLAENYMLQNSKGSSNLNMEGFVN